MTTLEKYHQQRVVTDKNRRTHYRVAKCPKSITVRLTTELNEHLLIKLYVMNFTKINVVSMVSVQRYITWCKHNSCSQISQGKKKLIMFHYIWIDVCWRKPKDAFSTQCLLLTFRYSGRSIIVWTVMSWKSLGPVNVFHNCMAANKYEAIFQDQVHHMVQTLFPDDVLL